MLIQYKMSEGFDTILVMQDYLSYFSGKVVVVTGVAGFIGSHLAEALLKSGATVIGVDNFSTGLRENINWLEQIKSKSNFTFIEADISHSPATVLSDIQNIAAVFHFASPASPPRYQQMPVATYMVNSWATHSLLDYLKQQHPQARFLFASTSEVYGDPQVHPQPESYWGNVNPNGVRSCYDESKRFGETICGVFERDFKIDVRIVRIFNTYGPRMNPIDGRVIVGFVAQALKKEKLHVFGDGTQTRSYCYISDLVDGLLRFMAIPAGRGQTINLGNPDEYTVLETAQIISRMVNPNLEPDTQIEFQPLPKDDPTRRQPDITKARQILEWLPRVQFQVGLAQTIEFYRQFLRT